MENSKKSPLPVVKKWYEEGLKFKCTGCGKCCTGSPGYVWIGKTELEEMAEHLKITPQEFVKKYTRLVNGNLALLEKAVTYDCIFLKGKLCQVYEVRPKQCRTYPWWPENVFSKAAWEEEGLRCEGINHPDAENVSLEQIEEGLSDDNKED